MGGQWMDLGQGEFSYHINAGRSVDDTSVEKEWTNPKAGNNQRWDGGGDGARHHRQKSWLEERLQVIVQIIEELNTSRMWF